MASPRKLTTEPRDITRRPDGEPSGKLATGFTPRSLTGTSAAEAPFEGLHVPLEAVVIEGVEAATLGSAGFAAAPNLSVVCTSGRAGESANPDVLGSERAGDAGGASGCSAGTFSCTTGRGGLECGSSPTPASCRAEPPGDAAAAGCGGAPSASMLIALCMAAGRKTLRPHLGSGTPR
mmetsp:Transcript_19917/g.50349  ORF Transcript_19917/g.50349 Transcript_19917/m.50349 type:complete len:178 (+) Transcript_19917:767-1300(+)